MKPTDHPFPSVQALNEKLAAEAPKSAVPEAREALAKPQKGSAYLDALEAFVRALIAESRPCPKCHDTGMTYLRATNEQPNMPTMMPVHCDCAAGKRRRAEPQPPAAVATPRRADQCYDPRCTIPAGHPEPCNSYKTLDAGTGGTEPLIRSEGPGLPRTPDTRMPPVPVHPEQAAGDARDIIAWYDSIGLGATDTMPWNTLTRDAQRCWIGAYMAAFNAGKAATLECETDAYEEFVGWVATTLIQSLDDRAKRELGQVLSELRKATDAKEESPLSQPAGAKCSCFRDMGGRHDASDCPIHGTGRSAELTPGGEGKAQ